QIDLYALTGGLLRVVPPGLVHSGQNLVFGAIFEVQLEIEQAVVDAGLLGNGLLDPPGVTHDRLQAERRGIGAIRGEVTEVSCCGLAESGSHRRIVPAVQTDIGEHADADDILRFEIGAQCRELLADVRVVPVDQRAVGDEGEALCRTGDPQGADDRDGDRIRVVSVPAHRCEFGPVHAPRFRPERSLLEADAVELLQAAEELVGRYLTDDSHSGTVLRGPRRDNPYQAGLRLTAGSLR